MAVRKSLPHAKCIAAARGTSSYSPLNLHKNRLIVGSADYCLAQLQRWQAEIQPDYLIICLHQPGGPTHQKTLATIRVFGEQVIPKL
jgi:alkanesulfonate monooxygenase SsuD/methylene tetrahydromethanopterin reductase-like flavin-dependent oxidoreductase (luciferase family)